MDMDKLKQWLEVAQNMQGGDFWKNIFEQDFAKQFMNDPSFKSPIYGNSEKNMREDKNSRTFPSIDILEGEEEVMVLIELPGVRKENIELGLNGDILTIKGTAMPIHPNLKIAYSERFYGEFQRQIKLPDQINPSEINAKFWNGILFVSYQRKMEKGEIIPID
ncbi:Hsp20/alpha crystallin family protein [Neobacillus cucumis]|uniref:Hsp20/alpha crystallin family protein n=1 Tax=Neobacillus cucumis TaxID=1740721 RepID=UPI0018E0185B|nr:Hsp20/alpha crystallin family protein [Neobacillus cucumis]MBI0575934.1 Hsp20/alpha crystallin family protein [Neobacillus cucumis]